MESIPTHDDSMTGGSCATESNQIDRYMVGYPHIILESFISVGQAPTTTNSHNMVGNICNMKYEIQLATECYFRQQVQQTI